MSHPQVVVHVPGSAAGIGCRGSCARGRRECQEPSLRPPWMVWAAAGSAFIHLDSFCSGELLELPLRGNRAAAGLGLFATHLGCLLCHWVNFWMHSGIWNDIRWSLVSILFAVLSAASCSLLWCEYMKCSPWKQHAEHYRQNRSRFWSGSSNLTNPSCSFVDEILNILSGGCTKVVEKLDFLSGTGPVVSPSSGNAAGQ